MKKIKYCCRNFKNGSKSVYKTIKDKYPDLKQKKKDCLGSCSLCSKQCIVMVGKKVVVASSPDSLYSKLKKRIG
jgi:uncharacterized protein YuzB (UPF0349 family)